MSGFEKAGQIALIVIGAIGMFFSGISFVISISPQDSESSISPAGWVVCGSIGMIISIVLITLGWLLISKSEALISSSKKYAAEPNTQYSVGGSVVVQNIGEYIAGNRMNIGEFVKGDRTESHHFSSSDNISISDSVVQKSRIGGLKSMDVPRGDNKKEILRRYKNILKHVLADGVINENEAAILEIMRKSDNISIEDHYRIMDEISIENRSR